MRLDKYEVVDDFQVGSKRVLVLDKDYEFGNFKQVKIEGIAFNYTLCSVKNWVIVEANKSFRGATIKFE